VSGRMIPPMVIKVARIPAMARDTCHLLDYIFSVP